MDCHALIPNPQTEPGASCIFCFTGGFFTAEPHGKPHDKLRQRIKNRDITLLTKVHTVKAMVFPVVMYGCWVHTCMDGKLGHKEGWVQKSWCFQIMVLEKTLESLLDSKEFKLVNPKGNQSWIFIGRTDAEAETPILWPPDAKYWRTGKDPDAGKDWRWEEKETTEDEMVGWHHQLDGHVFEQTPGDSGGHRSLVCYSPRGCK